MSFDRTLTFLRAARLALVGSVCVLIFAGSALATEALDRPVRLEAAIEAYSAAQSEAGRDARLAGFARARQAFASLVSDGVESAALYTNLGNAALQAQDPGEAVVAYHRALRIDPNHNAAQQNLVYVRTKLPVWVPRPEPTQGARGFLDGRRWPAEQRAAFSAICFLVAAVAIALSVRRKEGAWRGLALLAFAGWGLSLGSLTWAEEVERMAVVTGLEAEARSADSALAPLALPDPLPPGVEVDLVEVRGDWSLARLANGRDVWVRSSKLTAID